MSDERPGTVETRLAELQQRVNQLTEDIGRQDAALRQAREARTIAEERYADFRRKVVDTFVAAAEENDWCGDFVTYMERLGLKDELPTTEYEVTVTVRVSVPYVAPADDPDDDLIAEAVQEAMRYGSADVDCDRVGQ